MSNTIPKQLADFFAVFESPFETFEISLINNLANLFSFLRYKPVFTEAKNCVMSDPKTNAEIIYNRSLKLLAEKTVKKYRNMYDATFAAYLFLLSETSVEYTKKLIFKLKNASLGNLWWTNLMIDYVDKLVPDTIVTETATKHDDIIYKSETEVLNSNKLENSRDIRNAVKFL